MNQWGLVGGLAHCLGKRQPYFALPLHGGTASASIKMNCAYVREIYTISIEFVQCPLSNYFLSIFLAMRLLSTTTLSFGEFFNAEVPPYCILSHRWGEDEVTYHDVLSKTINTGGAGYKKIFGACRLAKRRGFEWIWIDTCCVSMNMTASSSIGDTTK